MSKPKDVSTLIDVAKTTQALLTHYQSSLAPTKNAPPPPAPETAEIADPLALLQSTTTLLRSHTTTLSLLLINPPLTPSALISKIGHVSSEPLSGMVAAAGYIPRQGQRGDIGDMMRAEVKTQVKGLLGSWGDVLSLVVHMAEKKQKASARQDAHVTEADKQHVLATTGVVWEACDALLKLCTDGVVGLAVNKAQEFRAVLLDAMEELKEWGEDVADDKDDAAGSDDEDEMFGAENKLGKDDKELKELLDTSVKKLKMVGMLYQALIKRRLKTYPASSTLEPAAAATNGATSSPSHKLDELMRLLKTIPESADDMAGAFYDLDQDEAKQELDKCCGEAKSAVELMRKTWAGEEDEFTTWSGKWMSALKAA